MSTEWWLLTPPGSPHPHPHPQPRLTCSRLTLSYHSEQQVAPVPPFIQEAGSQCLDRCTRTRWHRSRANGAAIGAHAEARDALPLLCSTHRHLPLTAQQPEVHARARRTRAAPACPSLPVARLPRRSGGADVPRDAYATRGASQATPPAAALPPQPCRHGPAATGLPRRRPTRDGARL